MAIAKSMIYDFSLNHLGIFLSGKRSEDENALQETVIQYTSYPLERNNTTYHEGMFPTCNQMIDVGLDEKIYISSVSSIEDFFLAINVM
jgi:hypothetical protein